MIVQLTDLNLNAEDAKQNQQLLLKTFLDGLPPLTKVMVEFASFYVPKNLSQGMEVEISTFLNRDNEYAGETISLQDFSIKSALMGENPALLQDLREFFVAEGQAQHNVSAAVYVGYMMGLCAGFAKQHAHDLNDALHNYDEKNIEFIMALIDKSPVERQQMQFHLHSNFDAPVDKFAIYLEKLANLKAMSNIMSLSEYIEANTPWEDAVNLYNQASNFISAQMPNLPKKLESYFINIYRNPFFDMNLQEYIHNKAQDGSTAAFEKANISMTDILPIGYWLAQVQSQGFYFMHNLLSSKVAELSQPIMYTVIAYRSALDGQPNETKSYLTKAKDYLQQDEVFNMLAQYGEFYFKVRNDFDSYITDLTASNTSDVNDLLIKYQVLSLWNAFQITHSVNTLLCQATHTSWDDLLKEERPTIVASSVIIKMQLNDMQQYAQKLCTIENNQLAKFSCELTQGMHKGSLYTAQQILGFLGNEEYESTAAQLSLLQQEALHYQAINQLQHNVEELRQSDDASEALWKMAKGLHQGNLINTIHVKSGLQVDFHQECELLELLQSDVPEACYSR